MEGAMSETEPPKQRHRLPARLLMRGAEGLLSLLILVDEMVRPLYRPAVLWLAQRRFVARAEKAIARLPRLAVLILLAVPFAIAEPLKLGSLLLIAKGQVGPGVVLMICAHLASFLIVERIYQAGRDKLLSYRWLAAMMGLVSFLRERVLVWLRASPIYAAAMRCRDAVRRWWQGRSA